ncbi:MAG: hypothetical protein Q8S26_18925 [Azonexus sp.]|nr:hypothetical protein [Azonexus sp.]
MEKVSVSQVILLWLGDLIKFGDLIAVGRRTILNQVQKPDTVESSGARINYIAFK